MSEKLPKKCRLCRQKDIKNVFVKGRKISDGKSEVFLICTPNQKEYPRLGIIVGKKALRKAVNRACFRRVAREAFRQCNEKIKNMDIIILAGKNISHGIKEKQKQIKKCIRKPLIELILRLKK